MLKAGMMVTPARDYASLRTASGSVLMWEIPVDALGIILDQESKCGSYNVAWNFGATGWVLRDNLIPVDSLG